MSSIFNKKTINKRNILIFSIAVFAILFLGATNVGAALTECEISCGVPEPNPLYWYEQCCGDGSHCRGASLPTGPIGYCLNDGSLTNNMINGGCDSAINRACCDNGDLHQFYISVHYSITGADCGVGNTCVCQEDLPESCSGIVEDTYSLPDPLRSDGEFCYCDAWCFSDDCQSMSCVGGAPPIFCSVPQCEIEIPNYDLGTTKVSSCINGDPTWDVYGTFLTSRCDTWGGTCHCSAMIPENCTNGVDDDFDGDTDCADSECVDRCNVCITLCIDNDGCCPTGCDSGNDNNCSPVPACGDGACNGTETCSSCETDCEPPSCSTCQKASCSGSPDYDWSCVADASKNGVSCSDGQWCTTGDICSNGSCLGSTRDCSAPCDDPCVTDCTCNESTDSCESTIITVCVDGDGCCPAGCDGSNDNDCGGGGPTSIGHIRIQGPIGIIKLDIISVVDAIAEGRGVVKVAMTAGDTNSAAYLVATTDLDASAVRVMTPIGIMAWKELP